MTFAMSAGGATAARPRRRFWAAAYSLLVLLTGTNLATPLYRDYERLFGFSPVVVTLVFAVYVAALIPSLLIAGPLSDAIGRPQVLLPAVVIAGIGAAVFMLADATAWLFVGRIVQGIAVGAASGALTAALSETEPHSDHRRAALVTTAASVGGLGLGPLVAGLLAQFGPDPRQLPFLVEIIALVPAAVAVATMPGQETKTRWRPRRPQIPADMRRLFLVSGTANFLAFAVIGLFLALVPTYVATLAHSGNLVLGGGAVAMMIACSVLAQIAAYGRPPHILQVTGLCLLAGGLVLVAIAGVISSLPLLLIATAIAGIGHGLVFLGGLTEVNSAAPAARRADVVSSFYVIVYLGVGVPVIGVGLLATAIGLLRAVQYFAVAVAVLCLVVPAVRLRRRARPQPDASATAEPARYDREGAA